MNKTIIELREEAIKEDKNPEFYLYQKLEEKNKEIERLNNIINELENYLEENILKLHNITGNNFTSVGQHIYQEILDKLKELKGEYINE